VVRAEAVVVAVAVAVVPEVVRRRLVPRPCRVLLLELAVLLPLLQVRVVAVLRLAPRRLAPEALLPST